MSIGFPLLPNSFAKFYRVQEIGAPNVDGLSYSFRRMVVARSSEGGSCDRVRVQSCHAAGVCERFGVGNDQRALIEDGRCRVAHDTQPEKEIEIREVLQSW